jgi:hypothetical protein
VDEHRQTAAAGVSDRQGAGASDLPSAPKAALPVVIGVVALFVILVVVIWRTGVFDKDTTASDAQIAVALLTLLGGLIASAFTLVGVLLKHSIDRRTAQLATETEHRLRLETSIKAVELLTMPDGTPAPSARQAGALYVLGSNPLEQLDLAVALLGEHWREGRISSSAAVWIVDRALTSGSPDLQATAAQILANHADRLPSADGTDLAWPASAAREWPARCDYFARTALLDALIKAIGARGPGEWDKTMVNWFIFQFVLVRRSEPTSELEAGATLSLDVLLDWYLPQDPLGGLQLPEGPLLLTQLRANLEPHVEPAMGEVTQQTEALIVRLRADWSPEPGRADAGARAAAGVDAEPPA